MTKLKAVGSLRVPTASKATQPRFTPPPMPACLDASLKSEYDRVCQNLFNEGLWHDDRLPLVVAYLSAHFAIQQCAISIADVGIFNPETGRPNQAVSMQNGLTTSLKAAAGALGLTVVRSTPIMKETPSESDKTTNAWVQAAKR